MTALNAELESIERSVLIDRFVKAVLCGRHSRLNCQALQYPYELNQVVRNKIVLVRLTILAER